MKGYSDSKNCVEDSEQDKLVHSSTSSVAICCLNAALMLEIADSSEPDVLKRRRMQTANAGQARLLREAAKIADDMLALLRELIDIEGPQPGTAAWADKVRAAIAKAEGR